MNFDFNPFLAGLFLVEWIVRVVMLFVVSRKQRTASANAWLLLIMIVPMLGTVIYYMFGNPSLPKFRREKLKVVKNLTDKELSEISIVNKNVFANLDNNKYRSISVLATKLGGLPPMHGNELSFFTEYDETFLAITKMIDTAEDYIHMQYFIAVQDTSSLPVFDALERAAKRGVTIRFMYDKLLSRRYKGQAAMRRRLTAMGAEVKEMLPLYVIPGRKFTRPDLRNHRKLVVIDGHIAFTGSQNLINNTYGHKNGLQYKELVARLTGPVVWQLNNIFRADWYAETGQPLLDVVEDRDLPQNTGSAIAQVLPSGPNHDHDNNLKLYTTMVHSAKQSINIVVPYFIPDESLLDALTTAAHRDVKVTIINSEVIDKMLAGHAQRSYYEELLKVGVEIYLYKKPIFLHTKQVIIDNEVAVFGSSNLDIRSFELDFELNTIIYDTDVVQKLKSIEQSYHEDAIQLSLKSWRSRPLRHKLLDQFTRLASAFL